MIEWLYLDYADLNEDQRRRVDSGREYALARWAEQLCDAPEEAGDIVEHLIDNGYLADHMSGLRWVASVLTPTTEG